MVDPDAIGLGLTVFVEIETGDHSKEWLQRFAAAIAEMPEVMEIYRMAGTWITLMRISVPTCRLDAFYQRLIALVPLKNVTSRFAMERVKYTTAYPARRGLGSARRKASTASAHSRPSRIAQTTSDCPRRMSPQAKMRSRLVLVIADVRARRCRARSARRRRASSARPARADEAHREQHQVGLDLELGARDRAHRCGLVVDQLGTSALQRR